MGNNEIHTGLYNHLAMGKMADNKHLASTEDPKSVLTGCYAIESDVACDDAAAEA